MTSDERVNSRRRAAGYFRRDRERESRNNSPFPWYSLTDVGEGITRASAVSQISRKTAEAALVDFMKRVQTINASSKYLYSIERVAVFGSFLGPRTNLGDVDVAVDLKSRLTMDDKHKWVEIFQQHVWESGKSFSTWDDESTGPDAKCSYCSNHVSAASAFRPDSHSWRWRKRGIFGIEYCLETRTRFGAIWRRPDASGCRNHQRLGNRD